MDSRDISKKINEIKLKKVKEDDVEFLYELLSERNKNENISHKKMPSFVEHKKFVMSKPYSIWYIILIKKIKVGAIYLSKQSEIGIHIKKKFRKFGIGESAIQSLMIKNPKNRFLANINPKNEKSKSFFRKMNFKLIQHTYEFRKDEKNEKVS